MQASNFNSFSSSVSHNKNPSDVPSTKSKVFDGNKAVSQFSRGGLETTTKSGLFMANEIDLPSNSGTCFYRDSVLNNKVLAVSVFAQSQKVRDAHCHDAASTYRNGHRMREPTTSHSSDTAGNSGRLFKSQTKLTLEEHAFDCQRKPLCQDNSFVSSAVEVSENNASAGDSPYLSGESVTDHRDLSVDHQIPSMPANEKRKGKKLMRLLLWGLGPKRKIKNFSIWLNYMGLRSGQIFPKGYQAE